MSEFTQQARGQFEVKMTPQGEGKNEGEAGPGASLGRLALDKIFHGDLQGEGHGQMLTAMSGTEGSAGYVAIERFSGRLQGRSGGFVFQHSGQMNRGAKQLLISVVPDSGHGELLGIAGRLEIEISAGQHHYLFSYSLPA